MSTGAVCIRAGEYTTDLEQRTLGNREAMEHRFPQEEHQTKEGLQ